MVRHSYSLSKMTETLHPPCFVTNEGARVAYILELFRLLKSIVRAALSVSVNQCFHTCAGRVQFSTLFCEVLCANCFDF